MKIKPYNPATNTLNVAELLLSVSQSIPSGSKTGCSCAITMTKKHILVMVKQKAEELVSLRIALEQPQEGLTFVSPSSQMKSGQRFTADIMLTQINGVDHVSVENIGIVNMRGRKAGGTNIERRGDAQEAGKAPSPTKVGTRSGSIAPAAYGAYPARKPAGFVPNW